MLKRRTILAGLTVLGLTLAVSTKVYGQSTSGPEAWETVYNEAVAGATTTVTVSIFTILFSLLQFLNLAGFWGG
ncbi:hypothetical protein VF14_31370 [Nostoc linckia z18]|jgi:hypothetical protein|uniref:Uncharacterized protein n=3 Tax=Nostoc TaxID=1177 RepID=A0A9Q5Z6S3_NOSLI|nr:MULTISPECIES: hypothetical protein [Nostoc]MBL1198847.1 hypothetical protein [Nostoc sp. GBBB01]MDZ8010846.1 hypothetical protein [Nostoc sp. ZfuVER08]PHK35897.1 hypothetical protein VF12_21965 [Nostoc linckia z15]PHK43718.1 hypothetical protein VF13_25825 [Nostoc linckia z16]MBC1240140.1 hypothetical protein [Nostoc sp. 2RC]